MWLLNYAASKDKTIAQINDSAKMANTDRAARQEK
jgi:hypothetical protein